MRKYFLAFAVLTSALWAQPTTVVGNWLGTLEAGPQKLRIGLHVSENDKGELSSSLDSLDQNALGIAVKQTSVIGNKIQLDIPALGAHYDGSINADASEMNGTFSQGGGQYPLQFKRVLKIELPSHPQDPKPPYPYDAEDVGYENMAIHLAGTLTLPRGKGPFPAAILITGSGPQDRDETLLGHKPFWIIADYLTRHGIAVLRVDDRGVGKSTGNSFRATLQDAAGDVIAGVEYLKGRKEIDVRHIGVLGHSEGGIIGPIAAARCPDIAFVVMLGGSGVTGEQVLYKQGELLLRAEGAPDSALTQTRIIQETVFGILKTEKDETVAADKLRAALTKLGLPDSAIKATIAQWNSPEMRSMIVFDPAEALRKVKAPVLALNGSRDIQVSAQQNLPAIAAALAQGGNPDFTVAELPGLNHLFQECKKCTFGEYSELEQTFSPKALLIIGDWIQLHTRGE